MPRRLRILTWHVHGNYLYYLSQVPHDFYLVADPEGLPGRAGRVGALPWGENVHDAPVNELKSMHFDAVLYQSRTAWNVDRHRLLSAAQRRLPTVYLEHDPPQEHPTNTRHWVDDRNVLLVHVTPFNALMWDSGPTPNTVVEHGVKLLAPATATYELPRGIVVVNNIRRRGRRLGADVFDMMSGRVPLDLVGMGSGDAGGLGEVANADLPSFVARYRFFFNPIRYTSLGLSIIEAMMVGLPIIGLATTELVTVIRNGENGFVDTRFGSLAAAMQALLDNPQEAARMGANARRDAYERFGIDRFVRDWMEVFARVAA
jgi:glycosyltransferase involved in cell wall biosynthesis